MADIRRYVGLALPVILPIGSVEQHGKHLPVDTDLRSAIRFAEIVARERGLLIAPPIVYGYAKPMRSFPGTISLESKTFTAMVREISVGLMRQGFLNILVINGHYENFPFICDAIEDAANEDQNAQIVALNWWDLLEAEEIEEIFGAAAPDWTASHAGVVETSLALRISESGVRREALKDSRPLPVRPYYFAPAEKREMPVDGVQAQLSLSNAEAGRKMETLVTQRLIALVDRVFMGGYRG